MTDATLPPGDHLQQVKSTADQTLQPYRLFVPTAAARADALPLLVVLHGKGVDHNAWFDLTPVKEAAERFGYLVAAPNGRGEQYYESDGERDVLDIIAELRREFPVDSRRIYLAGHSRGGWGTWCIGLNHPDLFAAICPMAAPWPDVDWKNADGLYPLIIHDADDDVVKVQASRRAAERLRELGIAHEYREETGFGHDSKMIGANLDRIFRWFNAHPRK